MSTDVALESTKPRFEEGMSWEKRRKDSKQIDQLPCLVSTIAHGYTG